MLVTLTKLLAPVVPFLCERMYRNLVSGGVVSGENVPESVHLCEYPQADAALLEPELNRRTARRSGLCGWGIDCARRRTSGSVSLWRN